MCGIIGFISEKENIDKIFKRNFQRIICRGIVSDTYTSKHECFGYSRLPTDGISGTNLNGIKSNRDGILLFNGLITNVDDLCDIFHLSENARKFDTDCLLEGFTKYKEEFLSKCRGMFAFAFITSTEIFLARDTIGIKPLYFSQEENIFGFSSEIKGLLDSKKVFEVLPGEIVVYNKEKKDVKINKFTYKSYLFYRKQDLEQCLTESIVVPTLRYLKQSNKNVALLLSGGLDSSLIAKLLIDNLPKDLKKRIIGFSIGTKESQDIKSAKKLASNLKIEHVCVQPYSFEQAFKRLKKIVYDVESSHPRVIRVALLQDVLAKTIKKHNIDIVLSGEGADELFYGYERFIENLLPKQIALLYTYFFRGVFFFTLLQRYDRVFARHQIEGRVPFLDQELVVLAQKYEVEEKISYCETHREVKVPLRKLAQQIDLPHYISFRKKEKMTQGATGRENSENEKGYLEKETLMAYGKHFSTFIEDFYYNKFHNILQTKGYCTEDEAMKMVKMYVDENMKSIARRNTL